MKNIVAWPARLVVLMVILLVTACATSPQPERPVEVQSADPEETISSESQANVPQVHVPIVARDVDDKEAELPAVTYLLNQAEAALADNELDKAGALSDRALQIDRKSPRAYLILAQAYSLENNLSRAISSARQGLLYTSEDSTIGLRLKLLLQNLQ